MIVKEYGDVNTSSLEVISNVFTLVAGNMLFKDRFKEFKSIYSKMII